MEQTVSAEASSVMVEAVLHKKSEAYAHVLTLVTLCVELTSLRSYTSVKGNKDTCDLTLPLFQQIPMLEHSSDHFILERARVQ